MTYAIAEEQDGMICGHFSHLYIYINRCVCVCVCVCVCTHRLIQKSPIIGKVVSLFTKRALCGHHYSDGLY